LFDSPQARSNAAKVMLLLTDGQANHIRSTPPGEEAGEYQDEDIAKSDTLQAALDAHDQGVRIYTISVGISSDADLMQQIADQCDGELRIVSCWEYELEGFLRRNSWISLPAEDVSSSVLRAGDLHLAKLGELVQKAGISGRQNVHHPRGRAGELIPHFCTEHKIDILVMGTVARTGIPGFLFGNTAENIVRKLNCSLLALKPEGFVSPVEI
ncbi:MAG TPA: universal stress protein, partial [Turneriella sp.]|nr:universal stress protein [Turneriella sp.]